MRFRTLLLVAVAALTSVLVASFSGSADELPPASAPVRVLTTDALRITLSPNPSASEIAVALGEALRTQAGSERDPTMRRYVEALGANADYLSSLSEQAWSRLDTDAGALAYQLLHVDVNAERVAIAAITAELLPSRGYVGTSAAHEDGHALINDQVALRCGSKVAREALGETSSASQLREMILDHLYAIGDEAHEIYHDQVNTTQRDFRRAAQRAVDLVTDRRC